MLLLTSTSDKVQVITSAAASLDVHTSWVDNASGTITPGRLNVVNINTATTTDIVSSPGASTQRNVKNIYITNTSGSVSTQATVVHTDGTNVSDLMSVTLLPGENLVMTETGDWNHHDAQGGDYIFAVPAQPNLGVTGTIAETIPREICPEVNTTAGATGTLFLQAIYLTAGQSINNISIWSATTAAGTPTNGFFAIYDINRNLVAQTANFTTEAWAANSVKTKALTATYRVPTSGQYYIGLLQVATTIATIKGGTAKTGGQLASSVPALHGTSTTGLTTTLPNPAAAITGGTASIYASVS